MDQHQSRAPCPNDLEQTLIDAVGKTFEGAMDATTLRAITNAIRLVTELREMHTLGEQLDQMESQIRDLTRYQA